MDRVPREKSVAVKKSEETEPGGRVNIWYQTGAPCSYHVLVQEGTYLLLEGSSLASHSRCDNKSHNCP